MIKSIPKLEDYYDKIASLPLQSRYTKETLLVEDFLIKKERDIEIYYAAHNEYFNPKAQVFIVGITPGFAQMEKSIVTARQCIEAKEGIQEMIYKCKKEARFSGSLRNNIISMLNELELGKVLGLEDASTLFGEEDEKLHTTSMLPFATFVKGKNYTGHTPKLIKSTFLMEEVIAYFYPQIEALPNALVIPLGKCVEEVLRELIRKNVVDERRCLLGFPHPSGANAHARKQFEEEKEQMMFKIKEFGAY